MSENKKAIKLEEMSLKKFVSSFEGKAFEIVTLEGEKYAHKKYLRVDGCIVASMKKDLKIVPKELKAVKFSKAHWNEKTQEHESSEYWWIDRDTAKVEETFTMADF